MQVDFYHLTRDPAEGVLPAIARRVLEGEGRLLIVSAAPEQLAALSAALWNAGPASYLAHDHADGDLPEAQPILLSATCAAPNGARNIALVDGAWREEALAFDRAFLFFDEHAIAGAREAWRSLGTAQGVERRYWRQEGGRWLQGP